MRILSMAELNDINITPILSVDQCRKVQNILFKRGFKWLSGDVFIKHLNAEVIYIVDRIIMFNTTGLQHGSGKNISASEFIQRFNKTITTRRRK